MAKPKVLVIGGGFAGSVMAVTLARDHRVDVTLVSKSDFFEAAFANARSIVEPSIADKTLWSVQDMKPHGTFVHGEVLELTDKSATLKDGRVLEFDFAAIATGSTYAVGKASEGVTTLQGRKAEVQALADSVKAAKSIVIVGGGPLGVELAGEILTDLASTEVTLVHSGACLLPALPTKLGTAAEAWLKDKGCKVILADKVDLPAGASGRPYSGKTSGGVQLSCDLLLTATGFSTNTSFMKQHLADALDPWGRVKVDNRLRVVGHPHLFAVGDVTDVPEEKLAFLAGQQGSLVAASLAALAAAQMTGGEQAVEAAGKRLGAWKPSKGMPIMFVSLGRNYGVGRIGFVTLTGWLPTRMKSRNVVGFVNNYRKQLLLQP